MMAGEDAPTPPAAGGDAADDTAEYFRHARALADAICDVLPGWAARSVEQVATELGRDVDDEVLAAAGAAGRRCAEEFGPRIRQLLDTDPDEQRSTPLTILRTATCCATDALRSLGMPPVERDEFAAQVFPDDVYDLAPGSFADVDPSLAEPGVVWGAAKAHVHLARRRAEGRR